MFDIANIGLFLTTSVLLIVTPGPDMMYVIARGVGQGRRAGLLSALGVCTGLLVHVFAAALGLSALLQASAVAYTAVKLIGSAYLIYLGVRTLLARTHPVGAAQPAHPAPRMKLYFQGVLSNVLNPKVALFFVAFLPQFVPASSASAFGPMLLLGLAFTALGVIWLIGLGLLSGAVGRWLNEHRAASRVMHCLSGTALIGLGLRLALGRRT
jgi:threonine/homoserine/homoserine lactone efflux protein